MTALPEDDHDDQDVDAYDGPSKSQLKRDSHALQDLGKALVELNADQLAKIPMPEDLLEAIHDWQRFKKHEARRPQLQYIGKLMRDIDATPIAEAVGKLDSPPPGLHKLMLYWREESAGDAVSSWDSWED